MSLWPIRLSTGLLLLLSSLANETTLADEPVAPPPTIALEQWVAQLADPRFSQREAAVQALSNAGPAAKGALLAGLNAADPEVRWRSALLWKAAQAVDFEQRVAAWLPGLDPTLDVDFPSWPRFSQRFGTSTAARRLYVEMQRAEPVLLAQFRGDLDAVRGPFGALQESLQRQLVRVRERPSIKLGSVATLWFLACETDLRLTPEESETLRQLAEVARVQDELQVDSPLKQLWLAWRRLRPDERPAQDRLMEFVRDGLLDQASIVAREILRDKAATAENRQYALLVLANSPDAADAADAAESTDSTDEALMSRFLDDASPLGVYLSRGVVIKSELRDVALAAIIRRSGADPRQFGFQYVKPGATFLYSPATLGFSDSPQREAAFAQWAQRHTP